MKDLHLSERASRGPLSWMVRNSVMANLLMIALVVGGLYMSTQIKQEVFPEFSTDTISVSVSYPGASPEDVEEGIVLAVEEAVRGLEGIKEVTATAAEGSGRVTIEILTSADRQLVYQDVEAAVSRITTFPDDAEQPEVSLSEMRRGVLDLLVYGDVDEHVLRTAAEYIRDRLAENSGISMVELSNERDLEIHVEIDQETLRRYGLTIDTVAQKIRNSAVEVPGGKLETSSGQILLRVDERRDWAEEFRQIPIVTTPDGGQLMLEDIATIKEAFEDTNHETLFNGQPSISIEVFRIGNETPIDVSDAAMATLAEVDSELPPGIHWEVRRDQSEVYRQRLELLLKNAFLGLVLVLILLSAFLEFKLAFWVTMGIPISFLGGLLILPGFDVSINMISTFAFIIALGIVVDDAIVVGENIYEYRQEGMNAIEAAIRGVQDIAMPVTIAVLTNVIAFLPLMFVPGVIGKIFMTIPLVVCTVFMISLIEGLFILPAHLAHSKPGSRTRFGGYLHTKQQAFSQFLSRSIKNLYAPLLRACLSQRHVTIAVGLSILILTLGLVASGRMGFIFMPRIEADESQVTVTLPPGSPMSFARDIRDRLLVSGKSVVDENGGETLSEGVSARINDNTVTVSYFLTDADSRPITTSQFTSLWRDKTGPLAGVESSSFESDRGGPGSGAALTIELSHRDINTLERASTALAERLEEISTTRDVDDGHTPGKEQLSFKITPQGESLGLTAQDIAQQVRYAFQGGEAFRQLRERNEITIRVRRPEDERASMYDLEQMIVQTPAGGEVPLMEVATVERSRAYTSISHRDGQRVVEVTADVEPISQTTQIQELLNTEILPQLALDYPGLSYGYEGHQAEISDDLSALVGGFALAMMGLYILLAIPFKSYIQPIIVMMAVPFGIVGAVVGHLIMGQSLSINSIMGIVALSGVVLNDSLVMIEYANRLRDEQDLSAYDAITMAGVRRFRPILLTTLTTFGGLAPMIFETSTQAQFVIPMAISLGFGILFSTAILLVIVPAFYVVLDDTRQFIQKITAPLALPDQQPTPQAHEAS